MSNRGDLKHHKPSQDRKIILSKSTYTKFKYQCTIFILKKEVLTLEEKSTLLFPVKKGALHSTIILDVHSMENMSSLQQVFLHKPQTERQLGWDISGPQSLSPFPFLFKRENHSRFFKHARPNFMCL